MANEYSAVLHGCLEDFRKFMKEGAEKGGQKIDLSSVSVAASEQGLIANAAMAGLSQIDMIDYEPGVTTNFLNVDHPDAVVPPGFYSLKVTTGFVHPGQIEARGSFESDGRAVAATSGFAIIHSLRVPEDVEPRVITGVGLSQVDPGSTAGIGNPSTPIVVYAVCSNGSTICIPVA
jgi:hypothetical protein